MVQRELRLFTGALSARDWTQLEAAPRWWSFHKSGEVSLTGWVPLFAHFKGFRFLASIQGILRIVCFSDLFLALLKGLPAIFLLKCIMSKSNIWKTIEDRDFDCG